MAIDLNLNTKGEDVKGRSRKEMLVSFYENNFHLIPCGYLQSSGRSSADILIVIGRLSQE